MTNDEIIAALADASKGLLYPSESDEPFATFRCPVVGDETPQQAVSRFRRKSDGTVMQTVSKFFGDLVGSDDAARFDALHKLIDASLPGAVVVRAGQTEVGVYVIGKQAGEWLGLQTKSVET